MDGTVTPLIRTARETDLPGILRIYNDAISSGVATWDEVPWTMEERCEWFAHHDEGQPVLVADIDGSLAGFASLALMSAKSGWRFTREDTIYIDPEFQGRGIGRALLAALLDEARRIGLRLIVASITSTNVASLALHGALGFEVVGTLRSAGFKFGEWHDTTYMQFDLQG
ncbi:MAG: N-acetyltransferase family protein [Dehalococcoidia bacterium]|nr:N-acetyltransferase family protein [Dehalococcoidia bacterium]